MTKTKNFSTFSVHFQIIQKSDSWVFGHFYFVIDNQLCGAPEDHAALNIVFGWIDDYLKAEVKLDDKSLSGLSDREIVAKIYDPYMVVNVSGLETKALFTGNSPHSISYLGMSAFDAWMILLLEFSGHQRLIWASLDDKIIYGARLPLFKVQQELSAALQRYKAELEQVLDG